MWIGKEDDVNVLPLGISLHWDCYTVRHRKTVFLRNESHCVQLSSLLVKGGAMGCSSVRKTVQQKIKTLGAIKNLIVK